MTLNARSSPSTQTTGRPSRSTIDAQSVASPACAASASRSTPAGKPCGVCTARRAPRSSVSATLPSAATRLTVSASGSAGTAPSAPARRAATTRSTTSGGTSGRAASCTSTKAALSGHAREAGGDRLGPRRAAGHGGGDLRGAEVVGQQRGALLVLLRHHHDDAVDQVVVVEHRERPGQHRAPAQPHERLRAIGPEPVAGARCDHDRPDLAGHGAQEASRVKIILPLGDCSTLVTSVSTSSPMWSRAPSTTIIVPSSR